MVLAAVPAVVHPGAVARGLAAVAGVALGIPVRAPRVRTAATAGALVNVVAVVPTVKHPVAVAVAVFVSRSAVDAGAVRRRRTRSGEIEAGLGENQRRTEEEAHGKNSPHRGHGSSGLSDAK